MGLKSMSDGRRADPVFRGTGSFLDTLADGESLMRMHALSHSLLLIWHIPT
jgi:hypothetical protein